MRKTVRIGVYVTVTSVVAAGICVLVWWLVTNVNNDEDVPYTVIQLEGTGYGYSPYRAAYTRINNVGEVFWWFYPSLAFAPLTRPIVVWLDGATGVPPSLLANLGMIGPHDINLQTRTNSWVNSCSLLFIDAPVGTGFSTSFNTNTIPKTVEENVEHLLTVLDSFYSVNVAYRRAPVYIFGQADGAKSAAALAIKLNELKQASAESDIEPINIQGIALGNGIISPATVMQRLGFYLDELGYINDNGRSALEALAQETNILVDSGNFEEAFDKFLSLGNFVNENAGAVAVDLKYIVDKLTQESVQNTDLFGQRSYIDRIFSTNSFDYMTRVVAPALGISASVSYDADRGAVVEAVRGSFMKPFTDQIEYILQSTNLQVTIYNGNLDAISNTPGQLDWVENLQWSGQNEFRNSIRNTLVVDRLIEGYFRSTPRLKFFWVNAAGQSAPLDNPAAMLRFLPMMIGME